MRFIDQLDAETLIARARTSTGLVDLGVDHFREPLGVLLRSMREEAQLNEAGAQVHAGRIVNALENRLRRVDLVKRHPEILDEQVEVGVVIVGLPRTGSTMLQRLLASSPDATAMYWWESIFPLPRGESGEADFAARKADAVALAEQFVASAAGFEAIHPMDPFAHDEELSLMEQSFISNNPEAMLYLPSYGEWLLAADQAWSYGELVEWLKILQWQDPSRRGRKWILKAPHHLTAVRTTLETFPDAVIAMTHRRVDHVMGSYYSMVASLTGGNTDADLSCEQAAHWTRRLRRNLLDMIPVREAMPHRFFDIQYRKLLADPIGSAAAIFAAAGIPVDEGDRAAWQAWLDGNKRDNRPSHKYDVADYGIDRDRLMSDFAFYSDSYIDPE
ncbi:MAG: sulfotransferase [Sphingomonadales bacterium]|nr:sulfotransferase [Sphingomonadales bacterium]